MQRIKKRDGRIVAFDDSKITDAMGKAFRVVRGRTDRQALHELTARAKNLLASRFNSFTPEVEQIQDIVEQTLMEAGLYDVARAYILYRERRRERREENRQEALYQAKSGRLNVVKRDGRHEPFDERKLKRCLQHAIDGYEGVIHVNDLVEECEVGLYEGIATSDIAELSVMTAKNFIERDACYSEITARLFLQSLYKIVIGKNTDWNNLETAYCESFKENLRLGVECGRLVPALLEYDLDRITGFMQIKRDRELGYLGLQTLYDRYFIRDIATDRCLETPQGFWMRVAMGLAISEDRREERAAEFYEVLSTLRYVCSTPTLFHSGTPHPQLSSCYLTTIEDDLNHIFKSYADNAQLSKWSGGLGNDWTGVRATGALIKSTGVNSQGVIPFLKIANDTTVAINRSGKRRGATCAYLETWHYDIEDFLDLRRNTGDERRRTHDMNTANWIPDLFIKRVMDDAQWTLFSPDETPDLHDRYGRAFEEAYIEYERKAEEGQIRLFKKVRAMDLWKKMITRLFETGHPWITFKDPCNIRSPQNHAGVVHSSNLCTEITLNTSSEETAVCNLGSVNLSRHIERGQLNRDMIAATVNTAMRMLDNVIDINFYPTPEARTANLRHRAVGLGIMGFQDSLYRLNIDFDSERASDFADECMELISYHAISGSAELARGRGAYESYPGSKWDRGIFPQDSLDLLERERGIPIEIDRRGKLDWGPVREAVANHGMRNSNCLAIAPTATIANISGCYPSIEPIYRNLYVKSNMSGEFTIVNRYLVGDLKALGLWNQHMLEQIKARDGSVQGIEDIPEHIRNKYKSAFEIESEWLIRHAARRGKWIDQSQSLNIFVTSTSGRKISDIYLYAWKMGLKTTYYLRTMAKSGIEKSTVSIAHAYSGAGGNGDRHADVPLTQQTVGELPDVSAGDLVCSIDDPDCEACQ